MRTIVIGDIHGCIEEFDELVQLVGFRKGVDRLICAGDLVDRGPDPIGVVRRVQEIGAESVMGNHEEKHLRYRRHELQRSLNAAYKNPMRPFHGQRLKEHQAFSEADWEFIAGLPTSLRIDDRWVVVHAGLEPGLPFELQFPNSLMRVRYVKRSTGRMLSLETGELLFPSTAAYWSELWRGPESVVYGHHVSKTGPMASTHVVGNLDYPVTCVGIDTGCCFGRQLTAAIIENSELTGTVSVHARAPYTAYTERE